MTSPSDAATIDRDGAPDPRVATYAAWVVELEARRGAFVARRPAYRVFFAGLVLAGFGCFLGGVALGVWGSVGSVFVGFFGSRWVDARVWEFDREIELTRGEIARMTRPGGRPGPDEGRGPPASPSSSIPDGSG